MLELNQILAFSHNQCVAICSFLVPTNFLATGTTLLLVFFQRPLKQINLSVIVANLLALTLIAHVATWLMIGVIAAPTFILMVLGSICISINLWAIFATDNLQKLLEKIASLFLKKRLEIKNKYSL